MFSLADKIMKGMISETKATFNKNTKRIRKKYSSPMKMIQGFIDTMRMMTAKTTKGSTVMEKMVIPFNQEPFGLCFTKKIISKL